MIYHNTVTILVLNKPSCEQYSITTRYFTLFTAGLANCAHPLPRSQTARKGGLQCPPSAYHHDGRADETGCHQHGEAASGKREEPRHTQ